MRRRRPPSAGKSPALAAVTRPLAAAEAGWRDEHASGLDANAVDGERHALAMKDWKAGGCAGDPPPKPARPTLRQLVLDDATTEAAARLLRDNPRGVALVQDELAGFVLALNQYRGGKGADRQFWLKAWALAPLKVSRAKDGDAPPLVAARPFVGVAGALCPALLPTLRGDAKGGDAPADGFIDRFLFAYPDPLPAAGESWASVPADLADWYAGRVAELLSWDFMAGKDGERVPVPIPFDAGGRGVWQAFTEELAGHKNALDPSDGFRATLGKLEEYGLRLAGLLWCVRRACDELTVDAPIDADTMTRAAGLVEYFRTHAVRCHDGGVDDQPGRVARRILRWLRDDPGTTAFTRSAAFQRLKDRKDVTGGDALNGPLRRLTDHGYIRDVPDAGGGRPGPAPQTFAVSPRWCRGDDGDPAAD